MVCVVFVLLSCNSEDNTETLAPIPLVPPSTSEAETFVFYKEDPASPHDLALVSMYFENEEQEIDQIFISASESSGQSGHDISVEFTVSSALANPDDTSIYFFAGFAGYDGEIAEGATVDADHADVTLGSLILTDLPAGLSAHSISLRLPNSLAPGEYQIFAFIDPLNLVQEFDESNNHPASDPAYEEQIFLSLSVSDEKAQMTNIKLTDIKLDASSIKIIQESKLNQGVFDASYFDDKDIEADITVTHLSPNTATTMTVKIEVEVDSNWYAINIWDSQNQQYSLNPSFIIDSDINHYIGHLHLNLPSDVRALIFDKISSISNATFNVRASVYSVQENESLLADNVIEKIVDVGSFVTQELVMNKSSSELAFEDISSKDSFQNNAMADSSNETVNGFSKNIGDAKFFSGALALNAKTLLQTSQARINSEATANLGLSVFGKSLSLFESTASMYCDPINSELGKLSSVEFFGINLYDDSTLVNDPSISFGKEFAKEQLLATATFMAGPIPITVKASAKGTIGMNLDFSYIDGTFEAHGNPYANFSAIGSGGVNAGVAEGGVQVSLVLVDDQFHVTPSMTPVLSSDNDISSVSGNLKVTNNLRMLDGKFGLYASVQSVKTCRSCKKVFGKKICASYPCGIETKNYNTNLFQMSGFSQSATLFDQSISYE